MKGRMAAKRRKKRKKENLHQAIRRFPSAPLLSDAEGGKERVEHALIVYAAGNLS